MDLRRFFLCSAIAAALTLGVTGSAFAQRPLQQVLDLNRQAMDAYNNLEIDQARTLLDQALSAAQQGGVRGAPLARTLLNLGVVAVGGLGDNASGLDFFTRALEADRTVQLDPLTSTPEIQTVFTLARQRAGAGNGGNSGNGGSVTTGNNSGNGGTSVTPPPEPPPSDEVLQHTPPIEQLTQTAVPIYARVNHSGPIGSVFLYYKGRGMREFRRVEMSRVGEGYGYEIPCSDVYEPAVEYYAVVFGADGSPLGFAGTAQQPLRVAIVSHRTTSPPALPGRAPPQTCATEECPPGMTGCHRNTNSGGLGRSLGDTCTSDSDCASHSCEDNFCVAGDGDDDDDDHGSSGGDDEPAPRFFIHVGGTLGLAYANTGMYADSPLPETAAPENSPWQNCDDRGGNCQVRIKTPGFVPTFALRVTAGYYVIERLAIAATLRFQPDAGQGNLAHMLLGARVQYLVTRPRATGLAVAPYLGASFGQIQSHPPQNEGAGPYIISGLNGAQLGTSLTYRFMRNFGIHLTPEINILYPKFLFDIDFTAGIEAAF